MALDLTPEKGLIFRITHVDNLAWILTNGLHCANGSAPDPNFVSIGNLELIGKRNYRSVPVPPGGTLADFVPFYFTPRSPMLLNIKTGFRGVTKRPNSDIAILISSCQKVVETGALMLFTDRHAYTPTAAWKDDLSDLAALIDWSILRASDFARNDRYPDKMERYQAEALVHRHVPAGSLLGIGCVSDSVKPAIDRSIRAAGLALRVFVRPGWYF